MIPQVHHHHNVSGFEVNHQGGAGHIHRAPNGIDFERVAVSEPAEDRSVVIPNTFSINRDQIPQTLVIPRVNVLN